MFGRAIVSGVTDGYKHLKSFLYKTHLAKSYTFNSIIPSHHSYPSQLKYFYIPRHKWHQGFAISDFLYAFKNNTKQSYRLYVSYPKQMKTIDNIFEDLEQKGWTQVLTKFWVRDFVELRAFWSQVYKLIFGRRKEQRQKKNNQKAKAIKKQMAQVDKKYPVYSRTAQKQNVF